MRPKKLIGKRFGDLVVKRDLGNDKFHCLCDPKDRECGRYRTVTRVQLRSQIVYQCSTCAYEGKMQRRSKRTTHRVEPPLPPEPPIKPVVLECGGLCVERMINGRRLLAAQPDCPKHSPLKRQEAA